MCMKDKFIPKYTCQFYLIKVSSYLKKLQCFKTQIHPQSKSQAQSTKSEQ